MLILILIEIKCQVMNYSIGKRTFVLIYFNLQIKPGLLIQDYEKREEKGKDKDFYYDNSYYAIQNVWIDGCPNK